MDAEDNTNEWQEPPLPEEIKAEDVQPRMSEAATLGNIFIEPGNTFEDLRRKPRFILAGLLIILAFSLFSFFFIQKVGYERIVRERIEASPQVQQMPAADREKIIESQMQPIWRIVSYAAPPIVILFSFLLGALIYWGGANAMGGSMGFLHALSVWIYSSFPPTIVFVILNMIVLFFKSADEIDINQSQSGLVAANPSLFIDGKEMPVLAALLSSFDLFVIWGWILAAIGLQKVGRISSGAAWGIVLILALVGIGAKVIGALIFR